MRLPPLGYLLEGVCEIKERLDLTKLNSKTLRSVAAYVIRYPSAVQENSRSPKMICYDHGYVCNNTPAFLQASSVLQYNELSEPLKEEILILSNAAFAAAFDSYVQQSRLEFEQGNDLRQLFTLTRQDELIAFTTLRIHNWGHFKIGVFDYMIIPKGKTSVNGFFELLMDKVQEYAKERRMNLYDIIEWNNRGRENVLLASNFIQLHQVPQAFPEEIEVFDNELLYQWTPTVSRSALIASPCYLFFIFDRPSVPST